MEELLKQGATQLGVTGVVVWFFITWMKKRDEDLTARLQKTEDWIRETLIRVLSENNRITSAMIDALNKRPCLKDSVAITTPENKDEIFKV